METKGFTISGKNLSVWVTIVVIIVGSLVDSALTRDQVRRNTKELEQYDLGIISYKLEDISKEVSAINTKTDQIFTLVQDYLKDQ